MIKNIIFDLGGVLISWDPYKHLLKLFEKEIADFLLQRVFESEDWVLMDQGIYTEKELWDKKKRELPEYRDCLSILETEMPSWLVPVEENVALIPRLKDLGFGVYVLSNFSANNFELVRSQCSFFELLDGMVISSHVKVVKPDEEIYRIIIEKYSLVPDQCLYIDDRKENVETGRKLGFRAIYLERPGHLKEILERSLQIKL